MGDSQDPLIGLTLSGLGLAQPETQESVFQGFYRLAAETGLNAVEAWMAPEHHPRPCVYWPEDYTPQRQRQMRDFLGHFRWRGVHLPFLFNNYIAPNPVVAGPAREQMKLGIRLAGELGVNYCVCHAEFDNRGFLSEDANFALYAEVFAEFADLAARWGMLYCAETCFFMQTIAAMERMVRQVARPNFGITLDSGKAMLNNGRCNQGLYDLIERVGCHVRSTHLYDYPATDVYKRVLPGCGQVDVAGVVTRLAAKGYRNSFHLETGGQYDQQKTAVLTLKEYVRIAIQNA